MKMEIYIKVNLKIKNAKEEEHIFIKMVKPMKDNGKMTPKITMEFIKIQKDKLNCIKTL